MHEQILPPNCGPQQSKGTFLIYIWVRYTYVFGEVCSGCETLTPPHTHIWLVNGGAILFFSRLGRFTSFEDAPKQ